MADDITDLTDSGESGAGEEAGKKPKKQKPAKTAEPDKGLSVKGDKDSKGKGKKDKGKKGGAGKFVLILVLILVLLLGGAGAALYLNLYEVRDIAGEYIKEPLISVIVWFDPEYRSINDELTTAKLERERQFEEREKQFEERVNEREAQLVEWEIELNLREDELNARENAASAREQQLNIRAEAQDAREKDLMDLYDRVVPIYRRMLTDQELEDMISISRSYTQMSPDVAAGILVELNDPKDVAAILYYMSERNAAAILSVMDADFAAELTEILLYS